MKIIYYSILALAISLTSCGSNESESAISTTTKEELPKQINCADIDGIKIEKLGDRAEEIPSDYTGAAFYCDNGVLRNLYAYKDGDMIEKRKFHQSGKLKMENIYNYGTQVSQKNWDENGLLTSETIWKDDERIEKCFDKDGNEIDCSERY